MRTTGPINAPLLRASSVFPSSLPPLVPTRSSHSPWGGVGGWGFQGAKVFSEATKDVSKCFLQVDMDFLSQLSGPWGLLSSSAEMPPCPCS